jgi:hypothetical protein
VAGRCHNRAARSTRPRRGLLLHRPAESVLPAHPHVATLRQAVPVARCRPCAAPVVRLTPRRSSSSVLHRRHDRRFALIVIDTRSPRLKADHRAHPLSGPLGSTQVSRRWVGLMWRWGAFLVRVKRAGQSSDVVTVHVGRSMVHCVLVLICGWPLDALSGLPRRIAMGCPVGTPFIRNSPAGLDSGYMGCRPTEARSTGEIHGMRLGVPAARASTATKKCGDETPPDTGEESCVVLPRTPPATSGLTRRGPP